MVCGVLELKSLVPTKLLQPTFIAKDLLLNKDVVPEFCTVSWKNIEKLSGFPIIMGFPKHKSMRQEVTQMVKKRKKDNTKRPISKGCREGSSEARKIKASTAYGTCSERLSPFGWLLALIKFLDLIKFEEVFNHTYKAPRREPKLGHYRMVVGILMLLFIGFNRLSSPHRTADRSLRRRRGPESIEKPAGDRNGRLPGCSSIELSMRDSLTTPPKKITTSCPVIVSPGF